MELNPFDILCFIYTLIYSFSRLKGTLSTSEMCPSFEEYQKNPCPSEYLWVSGNCYRLLPPMDRHKSSARCKELGGELAMIGNKILNSKLQDQFHSEGTYWIGLTYDHKAKKYSWEDKRIRPTFFAWANAGISNDIDQSCVIMGIPPQGAWTMVRCTERHKGLCQLDFLPSLRIPNLEIDFDDEPAIVFYWSIVTVTCSAYDATIGWPEQYGGILKFSEEVVHVTETDTCELRATSVLEIHKPATLNQTQVICCSTPKFHPGTLTCTKSRQITVLKPVGLSTLGLSTKAATTNAPLQVNRSRPTLQISYEGKPPVIYEGSILIASCTGQVDTITGLVWAFMWAEKWVKVTGNEPGTAIIYKARELDQGRPGFRASSTLEMRVSRELHGASLACFPHDISPSVPFSQAAMDATKITSPKLVVKNTSEYEKDFENLARIEDDQHDKEVQMQILYFLVFFWALILFCGVLTICLNPTESESCPNGTVDGDAVNTKPEDN